MARIGVFSEQKYAKSLVEYTRLFLIKMKRENIMSDILYEAAKAYEKLLYQHPKYKDPAVASKCIEKLDGINQIADKIADAIDNDEIGKEQEQTLPGRS